MKHRCLQLPPGQVSIKSGKTLNDLKNVVEGFGFFFLNLATLLGKIISLIHQYSCILNVFAGMITIYKWSRPE